MRSVLVAFVSATVSLIPATARPQEAGPVAIELNGQPGFFVPANLFLEFERRYEAAPSLRLELDARRTEARRLRRANLKLSLTASVAGQRAGLHEEAWRTCEQDLTQAHQDTKEAAHRPWHESRALWTAVGAAATIGVAVAVKRAVRPGE